MISANIAIGRKTSARHLRITANTIVTAPISATIASVSPILVMSRARSVAPLLPIVGEAMC